MLGGGAFLVSGQIWLDPYTTDPTPARWTLTDSMTSMGPMSDLDLIQIQASLHGFSEALRSNKSLKGKDRRPPP